MAAAVMLVLTVLCHIAPDALVRFFSATRRSWRSAPSTCGS